MTTTKPRFGGRVCLLGAMAALCALGVGRARAQGPVVFTEAHSREIAVFNSTPAMPYAEAVSREATLYNSQPALVFAQAFSREAITYVSDSPIVDSISRETVVFNGYYVPEALDAFRIAGGLQKASPTQIERFQMALQMASENRISLAVAANILRIAIRLQ